MTFALLDTTEEDSTLALIEFISATIGESVSWNQT